MEPLDLDSFPPVLLVDLAKWFGGVDVRVLDMARALHNRIPYTVAVLTGSDLEKKLKKEGLNVSSFPYQRYDLRLFFGLRRLIQEGNYKVVDAHNPQSQFWGLLAAKTIPGTRLISSVHTIYTVIPGGWKGQLYDKVLRLNRYWNCQFITVSSSIVSYLEGLGIAQEKVALIYNGVTPLPLAEIETHKQSETAVQLKASFGWEPTAYIAVVVGRLETQKGHTYLLDALHQLGDRAPQLRCLFVGDGRLRAELEEKVKKLGLENRVQFAGFRDDIEQILGIADLFCLPSITEGLPFALLEACAQAVPGLLSDVDGMGELFKHKETAYLVPSTDISALVDGLEWFYIHRIEGTKIGVDAHRLVAQTLNPVTMIEQTLQVYHFNQEGSNKA